MLLLSRWNGLTSNGSVKAAFLLAITSSKRVGELYALSVADKCIRWSADGSVVTLWPNPSFLPKGVSTSHVYQPVQLAVSTPQQGVEEVLPDAWLLSCLGPEAIHRQNGRFP